MIKNLEHVLWKVFELASEINYNCSWPHLHTVQVILPARCLECR